MNMMTKGVLFPMIIAVLCLGGPSALAKGGGHGGGAPSGFGKGEKKGWKGEETPPGWSKGKKKSWGESDMPPGLSGKGSENEGEDEKE